jgi:predicted nucleic acid-binding Zn ribbon protein
MNPLAAVLETALRRLELTDAALEARAVVMWPQVVGEVMARATEAQRVRGGVLLVATRSSAWSQELSFHKRAILRTYKERLGTEFIRDIRYSVGAVRGKTAETDRLRPPEAEVRAIALPSAEVARIAAAGAASQDPELAQAIRRALTLEAQLRAWHLAHGARACPGCGAAFRTPGDRCPACRLAEHTERPRPQG